MSEIDNKINEVSEEVDLVLTKLDGRINAKQDKIDDANKLPASSVEGLATVATTGSYNDLADQPVIPAAANDARITITQGGVEKGSFTLNQADPATIEVDAGGADDVNYLTFVAEEAGSTLHLDKVGDATLLTARLQYRLNDGDWIDYNWTDKAGDPITLTNIGDKVQFKATDQNEQSGVSYYDRYKFVMAGKIAGSGSIMTLLDETDQLRDLTGKDYCFRGLFNGCASLTEAPELPATTLAHSCYHGLFEDCTSLTTAPELPATTLANNCYLMLFLGCTSLTKAPELPATTLADQCYSHLFNGCTSLTAAPDLPATTLADHCYAWLFYNCRALKRITIDYSGGNWSDAFTDWTSGVSSTGAIICSEGFPKEQVPAGWTRVTSYDVVALDAELKSKADKADIHDAKITITQGGIEKGSFTLNQLDPKTIEVDAGGADDVNHLTFTAEEAGSKLHLDKVGDVTQLTARLQYRLNGGDWVDYNWTELAGDPITLTNIGDNVQFKATDQNEQFSNSDSNYYQFAMTGKIAGSGSIMTLLDKTDQLRDLTGKNYCFCNLFQRCEGMVDAPELPSTKLAPYCYFGVFDSCINLKSAPELPATTMMTACYAYAFRDCLRLEISPSLPATELASECYCSMLSGTNLYQAPELPATTLAPYCYKEMLVYCSSLRTVPSLPATELAEGCYLAMFQSCDSLTKINIGYSGPSNSQAFDYWIGDTMMGGTIVCPEGFPAEHIPMGWTRVTSYDDEALDAELQSKADKSELPVNPVVGSAAGMKLWTGLQSEYDGIQTKDPSTVYVIKEG